MKVYVSSFNISPLDYVDKKSMDHPCVTLDIVRTSILDLNIFLKDFGMDT